MSESVITVTCTECLRTFRLPDSKAREIAEAVEAKREAEAACQAQLVEIFEKVAAHAPEEES